MRRHEINGKNGKELIFLENQSPDVEARSINLLFDSEGGFRHSLPEFSRIKPASFPEHPGETGNIGKAAGVGNFLDRDFMLAHQFDCKLDLAVEQKFMRCLTDIEFKLFAERVIRHCMCPGDLLQVVFYCRIPLELFSRLKNQGAVMIQTASSWISPISSST